MKRAKIFFVLFAVSILFVFPAPASADLDLTECEEDMGGTWNDGTSTCTVSVGVTITDSLTIPDGATLYIDNDGYIHNHDVIYNYGIIENDNYIHSYHVICNYGTINNFDGGTINIVDGLIYNFDGGTINNIDGLIRNFDGGTINNIDGGIIRNFDGGTIHNDGGIIHNDDGTINNEGTFKNDGGIIYNEGTFVNNVDCTISNFNGGYIKNFIGNDTLYEGIINNDGNINNGEDAVIDNYENANINNYGTMHNYGTINNYGIIHNWGTIHNHCGGTISGPISDNPVNEWYTCFEVAILPSPYPFMTGKQISTQAYFTGKPKGTLTATWYWNDGTISQGVINEIDSSVTGTHIYSAAGIYTVKLTITDDSGSEASDEYRFVIIYDPDGGFVSGNGWIDSPKGAYASDASLTGRTSFDFLSEYEKGAVVPTGQTKFQFRIADLNFHSNAYEWLVVVGPKAVYQGIGTINGKGNYGFMLSVIDEKLTPGTDVDMFRIKIWDKENNGAVVYDNQMGDADDADLTKKIGGGSIIIQQK